MYLPFAGIHAQTRDGKDEVIVGAGSMVWTGSMWVPVSDQNRLPVEATLSGQKTEQLLYGPNNQPEGTTPGFWAPRDTNARSMRIPHARIGIFDQVIHIRNMLDVPLRMWLVISTAFASGTGSTGTTVWIEENVVPDSRWTLVPEKGVGHNEPLSGIQRVFAVPELRQPYWEFELFSQAVSTPSSGELNITIERRF